MICIIGTHLLIHCLIKSRKGHDNRADQSIRHGEGSNEVIGGGMQCPFPEYRDDDQPVAKNGDGAEGQQEQEQTKVFDVDGRGRYGVVVGGHSEFLRERSIHSSEKYRYILPQSNEVKRPTPGLSDTYSPEPGKLISTPK